MTAEIEAETALIVLTAPLWLACVLVGCAWAAWCDWRGGVNG